MHIDSQINKNQPLFHLQVHPLVVVLGSLFPSIHFEEEDKVREEEEALLLLCPDDIYVDAMYL